MTRPWPVVLVIFAVAEAISGAAQIPTFSIRSEEVRIDALVTDHRRPVRGLTSADFEVRDNGVLQQIEFASFEKMPVNAILVFDLSRSVAGERLDNLKSAGRALLDALKKDDCAALMTFSHLLALGSSLTTDLGRVKVALDQARSFGNTSVIDASYSGLTLGESDSGRALLIVFSDGLDTSSWLASNEVLDTAKRSNAVVYAVSAGRLSNLTFLRDLSSLTGGSLLEVESTKNLGPVFLGILEEFRQRYLITYSPRGVPKDGWHRLDVRVKGRNATVKARPGYLKGSGA